MQRGRKHRAEDRRQSGVKSKEQPAAGRSTIPLQAQPPEARKRKAKRSADPPPVAPAAPLASAKDQAPKARRATRPKKKQAAAKRNKPPAQRARKAAAKLRGKPLDTPAVIALPHLPEPLVEPEPAIDLTAWLRLTPTPPQPQAPLPRSLAPVAYRSGGMLGALADWLGTQTQAVWRRMSGLERPVKRRRFRPSLVLRRAPRADDELLKLRAENERLRLQLEALLALQTGAADRITIPQS